MSSNTSYTIYKKRWAFILVFVFYSSSINAMQPGYIYPLIPYPTQLTEGVGSFEITRSTTIVAPINGMFKNEAEIASRLFENSFGKPLKQASRLSGPSIQLLYNASVKAAEGYHLTITTKKITLEAASPAGMFRAVQTLRQLLPASAERLAKALAPSISLPALIIQDAPVYAWRGMHLDVSRHFFSIAYLKKIIDLMALYKLNKFHLHLTDDQGWRIEIKKYPKLTSEGAWRTFNNQDSVCMQRAMDNPDFNIDPSHIITKNGKTVYGGFYTQKQMKDIVSYATARHIDIIPEIDMPGHMMTAINSYGYLSCDGKSVFGELFSTPVCPCLPTTYEFAQNVFSEIMDIFPGEYIHIGGDEVDRSSWGKSPACKALMAQAGLKTTAELQSYFIRRMEKFFNAHGKKLIGWDEILEGGISKTAMIMYWRIWKPDAPSIAAKAGNKVIMTPNNLLYFDNNQDKNSLSNIYYYNPVPRDLTGEASKNIIGAQASTWTEYIPSEGRADYSIMPRLTAVAEMLWTNQDKYTSYLQRLNAHFGRLDYLNVKYRLPDLAGLMDRYAFADQGVLKVDKPLNDLDIRYTLDSTLPNKYSTLLQDSLKISQSQFIRLAAFKRGGARGDVYDLDYQQQSFAEPGKAATADGLLCGWYKNSFNGTAFIPSAPPDGFIEVKNILVPKEAEAPVFALRYNGYINVPQDGIYNFYLTCDDGGVLKIADRMVVNNDGLHPAREKNGQVALKKGAHKFLLEFVEGGGGYMLKLQYSLNGSSPQDIPSGWLKH